MKSGITITMQNSPMVKGVSDKEPRGWCVRGFMEGMVSAILGVEATAFEIACEAVNRTHCEFKVAWKLSLSLKARPGDRRFEGYVFTKTNILIRDKFSGRGSRS